MERFRWMMIAISLTPCLGNTEKLFGSRKLQISRPLRKQSLVTQSIKYGLPSLDPHHVDSFFEMPRSRSGAESDGWAVAEDHMRAGGYAVLCRNNDYRLCLLYDAQGSVAGVQISISVEDVRRSSAPYPMDPNPMQERKRILDTDVYAATLLFVDDDVLRSGGRMLTDELKTAPNGMYVMLRNGERRHIPIYENDIEESLYRKQGCQEAMGQHYFYNISSEMECADLETFAPIYCPVVHELVGVNYMVYGRTSVQRYGRRWFEGNGPGFKRIAPDAPDCMQSWADSYGVVALHIYVANEPWNIPCLAS